MTRDFNKPRRDDSRPSFRNSSPNRNRDERAPRPARPRLNRETVDRAWESGAQQQHADYRPRTGGGQYRPQGQQQRNSGWHNTSNNQQSGYSSQNDHGGSRPYNNRQENFRDNHPGNYRDNRDRRDTRDTPRRFDRPAGDANGSRPSYGQERRDLGGQRFSDRRDSFNGPNRRGGDARQQFQERGNQRHDFGRNDRPARDTNGAGPQRETSNPRWQSRPGEQRNNVRGPERAFNRRPSDGRERFEGDYEHFEERDTRATHPPRPAEKPFEGRGSRPARPAERPFSGSHSPQSRPARRFDDQQSEMQSERHVTRLPDGRVLKGPRPVQRRNAQFWTGVTKDTNELVDRVNDIQPDNQAQAEIPDHEVLEVSDVPEEAVLQEELRSEVMSDKTTTEKSVSEQPSTDEDVSETAPQKRRTRIASAVARTKKPATRTAGPRPSQRGFKWPTQE